MSSSPEYWINSAAWFLGGCATSSIYWRIYVHRKLVQVGAAKREQPLNVFVAMIVLIATVMGLLFSESNRLALQDYVHCQAAVNQQFRNGYSDRVVIAKQDRDAIDATFQQILGSHLSPDEVRTILQSYLAARAKSDAARARHPVVVNGDCTPPSSATVGGP